jgi:hypothetical protein
MPRNALAESVSRHRKKIVKSPVITLAIERILCGPALRAHKVFYSIAKVITPCFFELAAAFDNSTQTPYSTLQARLVQSFC